MCAIPNICTFQTSILTIFHYNCVIFILTLPIDMYELRHRKAK